ncbi:MrcB family domain-containing protein [Clostridium sp. BSD9I1]|uniref:MrcB family domain-containing protein n=1 Tax=Clostridium sp. BSD9I1 TaxID=2003589 RepID=UPI001A9A5543|nr:DUF3578 domain-containing protein [Clostridium sp. BSD9I1]
MAGSAGGWIEVNEEDILGKKLVDRSIFINGTTIPKNLVDNFSKQLKKHNLGKGEEEEVAILIDGKKFRSILRYVNTKDRDDIYQINFRKEIKDYLKEKLHKSYKYIFDYNEDPKIKRPEEYIGFYKTNESNTFRVELTSDDYYEFEDEKLSIRERFLNYIGDKNSLGSNYQKSYKLVLLIELLNNVNSEGKGNCKKIYEDITNYYIERHRSGLPAESSDSKIAQNINNLSLSIVKSVINENAYKVVKNQGYIYTAQINRKEYLCFNDELWRALSIQDLMNLNSILNTKLELYYKERVKGMEDNKLKNLFQYVIDNYVNARSGQEFKEHQLGETVRKHIPTYLKNLDFINSNTYEIKGSIGQGNWAKVPWVAIMNKSITNTTQKGVYVVYLFSEEMDKLYLTLNQGVTEYENKFKKLANKKLQENAESIRKKLSLNEYEFKKPISLGEGGLGKSYEAGAIATIEYNPKDLPNDNVLKEDLLKMLDYYEKYANTDQISDQENDSEEVEKLNIKDAIEHIHNYILSQGYTYDIDLIKNYYLSLKTKPFVLLSGISGTGKSKLVQLFAEAIGSNSENERFTIIPVRPDWSDPSDLLGYKNIEGKFLPGPLTTVISRAVNDLEHPYFVCLDEMNLARVEYYFSDILSLMETRHKKDGKIVTEKIFKEEVFGEDEKAMKDYGDLYMPQNLYFVGTVNMDETTFPFSKKVLDRANTIEFNEVDLNIDFAYYDSSVQEIKELNMQNSDISSKYLKVVDCLSKREKIEEIIPVLNKINEELKEINQHFAFRVRDEVIFYILYAMEEELMNIYDALDHAIRQKILPRVQGSNISVKSVLINLYKLFSEDFSSDLDVYDNSVSEKIFSHIKENKVKYPLSSKKVAKMIRRFDLDGFTTFWE